MSRDELKLKCQGDPSNCPFNRTDLEPHHEPFSWIEWTTLSHTTMRCRICKVTFEEWVVLQLRQLQRRIG